MNQPITIDSLCAQIDTINRDMTALIDKIRGERDQYRFTLEQLDGWLEATGHGADHPWRLSIARAISPDEDPTPWCTACGARKRENCRCGPIAENE